MSKKDQSLLIKDTSFRKRIMNSFSVKFKWYELPLQNGGKFRARMMEPGIEVDNLGSSSLLEWRVFDEIELLYQEKGSPLLKGDPMSFRLGESGLPMDSIEGRLASKLYGKLIGDSVFRRISPITGILIWAGICKAGRGRYLELDSLV